MEACRVRGDQLPHMSMYYAWVEATCTQRDACVHNVCSSKRLLERPPGQVISFSQGPL